MSNTVNDFIQRFGSGGTVDDRQASQYYDRFASAHPDDNDFDQDTLAEGAVQHLGRLDDDEFERASNSAYQQTPPAQRTGLLQSILGGLQGRGLDLGSLASKIGLGSTNPHQMDQNDYSRLANYTRREHPEVLQNVVKQQPWFVKALGNPVLMGALTVAAAKMLSNQRAAYRK